MVRTVFWPCKFTTAGDARRIGIYGFGGSAHLTAQVALHLGLRYGRELAGIVALSTYMPTLALPDRERLEAELPQAQAQLEAQQRQYVGTLFISWSCYIYVYIYMYVCTFNGV